METGRRSGRPPRLARASTTTSTAAGGPDKGQDEETSAVTPTPPPPKGRRGAAPGGPPGGRPPALFKEVAMSIVVKAGGGGGGGGNDPAEAAAAAVEVEDHDGLEPIQEKKRPGRPPRLARASESSDQGGGGGQGGPAPGGGPAQGGGEAPPAPTPTRRRGRPPAPPKEVKEEVESEDGDEVVVKEKRRPGRPPRGGGGGVKEEPTTTEESNAPKTPGRRGRPPKAKVSVSEEEEEDDEDDEEGQGEDEEDEEGSSEPEKKQGRGGGRGGRKRKGSIEGTTSSSEAPEEPSIRRSGRPRAPKDLSQFAVGKVKKVPKEKGTITIKTEPEDQGTPDESPAPTVPPSPSKGSKRTVTPSPSPTRGGGGVQHGSPSRSKEVQPPPAPEAAADRRRSMDGKKRLDKVFEGILHELKSGTALAERWTWSGVLWDPAKRMKMIAASEIDLSPDGILRLKRCVQIFENMSVKILIDDLDMTSRFGEVSGDGQEVLPIPNVSGPDEILELVTTVSTAKLCTGLKSFEGSDSTFFPNAKCRGGIWYSEECPVILDFSTHPGPVCPPCNKLRNSVRRRRFKERSDSELKKIRNSTVKVQSKFGQAIYTLLSELMNDEEPGVETGTGGGQGSSRKKSSKASAEKGKASGGGGGGASDPSGKPAPKKSKKETKPKAAPTPKSSTGKGSGSAKIKKEPQQPPSHPQQVLDHFMIGSSNGNNIIIQNGNEFTLAEDQEYEVIGEAEAPPPLGVDGSMATVVAGGGGGVGGGSGGSGGGGTTLQVMDPENNEIEIIEVDEQTMAQLTAQNVFFQDSGNIQVTQIDPNDPNVGQFLKVLGPQGFFQHH